MARQGTTAVDYFRLGDWIVKPEQRLLQRGEQTQEISARSMDVLVHLAEHAGEVVSAEQLLIECWRGTFYGDNPVHKAIAELRKQLGDHAQSPDFIVTIRKRGYRLIAPVSFPENFTAGSAPAGTAWADGSPFRGLQPFDAQHAPVFFGRSSATAQILQALREQYEAGCAFVLCMGPSGCGKTSLIRAGVLPLLLQRGGFDGMEACSVADMTSMGNDALGALAHAMLAWRVDQRPVFLPAELALLTEQLETEPEIVAARVVAALSRRQPMAPTRSFLGGVLVLVVDALEGMFADALFDETHMAVFVRALDACARSRGVLVIATCRNDFYPRLVKLPVLIELKQGAGLYDVKPMTRGEIAQMIRRPAQAAALTFARDPGNQELLDDAIRDAAVRHPEALPLLQYTLQELYVRRSDSGVLGFDAYRQIGGLEGALGVRAEAIFQQLGSEAQSALPWLLQQLIQMHADDEGVTGRRVAWSQFNTFARRHLVEGLVDARLLVSELAIDEPVVSVAHEALLRHWPRVVDWVNGNRVALQVRARLATVVQRWQREARRRDLLLPRGRLLDEAYALLGNPVVLLSDEELAFIRTSHRYVQWAQRARMLMIALIALLGLAALIAAELAIRAQHDAERRRGAAEDLIGFMLGDLSERLKPLGRLDLLDRVSSEALSYLADAESKESKQRKDSRDSNRNASLHRAKALMQLGDIRLARADREHARTAFSRALDVLQQLHTEAPADTEILAELGKANFWVGLIDFRQRDLLHASEAWERYRNMATMRMMLEPDNADAMLEVSYAYNNLGTLASAQARQDDAIAAFQRSIELKRKVLAVQPANDSVAVELADSLSWVGTNYQNRGRLADAGDYYRQEFEALSQARIADPTAAVWRYREALALSHIAGLAVLTGDFATARSHYRDAHAILVNIVEKQPDSRTWQHSLAVAKIEQSGFHLLMHESDLATPLLTEAISSLEHLLKQDATVTDWQLHLALGHRYLAMALAQHGQVGAAQREAARAVEMVEQVQTKLGANPVNRGALAQSLIALGEIEQASGAGDAAARAWQRAADVLADLVADSSDPRVLEPWVHALIGLHRDDQAAPFIRRLKSLGFRQPINPPLLYQPGRSSSK